MGLVNDGLGCILESANPHTGRATLSWCPLNPVNDKAGGKGALDPTWNADKPDWEYLEWISLEAKSWAYDDAPPFSWVVTVRPAHAYYGEWPNVETILLLFVAPHVRVKDLKPSIPNGFKAPFFQVIRLDSPHEVPLPGMEAPMGSLVGPRPLLEYFNGILPPRDRPPEERGYAIRSPDADDTRVLPSLQLTREGTTFTLNRPTQYQIIIRLHAEEPSFFRVYVSEPQLVLDENWFAADEQKLHHTFYIAHSPNTVVEFWVPETAVSFGLEPVQATVYQIAVPQVIDSEPRAACPEYLGQAADRVMTIVGDNYADPDLLGINFLRLEASGAGKPLKPEPSATGIGTLFTLGVGFIPVVGQLYDIADMASIAVTGRDLQGASRTKTDILLIGAFCLFGVLGDAARMLDINLMAGISRKLFPGQTVVSLNPGFRLGFARGSFMGSPAVLDAVELIQRFDAGEEATRKALAGKIMPVHMFDGDPDARLREMKRLLDLGDPASLEAYNEMMLDVVEAVLRHNAEKIPFEKQPATLQILREYSGRFKAALLGAEADEALCKKAVAQYEAALLAGKVDDLFDTVRSTSPELGQALRDAVAEQIKADIIRSPSVQRRTRAYNNQKGTSLDPLEYLIRIAGKDTEARVVFDLTYGEEAWSVVTGFRRRPPPAELLQDTGTFLVRDKGTGNLVTVKARYDEMARTLMNSTETYHNHLRMTEEAPGFRELLNSDHLLEERFRELAAVEDAIESDLFTAMLVPANRRVARALNDQGIEIGWYVHGQKTNRMRQLIPYGREIEYSTQQIADIYQYFWVHEMGMPPKMFQDLYAAEFHYLDRMRKIDTYDDDGREIFKNVNKAFVEFKDKAQLIKNIRKKQVRMGLDILVEAKAGNRVSDAPGVL